MKIFEVVTEYPERDSNEITRERQYVTAEDDTMLAVAESFTRHCHEYEKELVSIGVVANVVQHVPQGPLTAKVEAEYEESDDG